MERQQGGAPFPGTGRGPPARGKGSSPGEIGVGFTTAQLEQLGAAIQSAVVPLSDTLTREVTALRARVDYLNARVDTEVASRTPVIRAAPQSVSSEGLSGVSITVLVRDRSSLVRVFRLHHRCHDHQVCQQRLA